MDNTTATLAARVSALRFDDLSASAIQAAEVRIIDSIGCLFGGYASEPARIARAYAGAVSGRPSARVLGSSLATSMEMAAFANTAALRYLDFNDTYIALGSGHPSDMLPAALAVADAHGVRGRDFLVGLAASYEVFAVIADRVHLRQRGWDQGVAIVLGSAAGAGKLLGLDETQLGHALAMAVTANVATRQTRSGELSMWKGCATAAAARAGVFCAGLAKLGMTGPSAAFEGRHGAWEQVTGPFDVPSTNAAESFAIERSHLKAFPTEYHSQAPLWLVDRLRTRVSAEDVESIAVRTYHMAWSEIGSEPEKWRPNTRETADHSLPYLLADAFRHGPITLAAFEAERIGDPRTHQLMDRITIVEEPAFTSRFPREMVSEIQIATSDGKHLIEQASYPRGHVLNRMSDEEIERKFHGLCGAYLPQARRNACLEFIRGLHEDREIGLLFDLVDIGPQA